MSSASNSYSSFLPRLLPSLLAIFAPIWMTQISPCLHNPSALSILMTFIFILLWLPPQLQLGPYLTFTKNCSKMLSALLWVSCAHLPTFSFYHSNQSTVLYLPSTLRPLLVSSDSIHRHFSAAFSSTLNTSANNSSTTFHLSIYFNKYLWRVDYGPVIMTSDEDKNVK